MSITYLPITITHPTDRTKHKRLDFLVDSGAVYSFVPSKLLKELGIRKEEEREFILANRQRITRKLGIARFEYSKHT